MVSIRKLPLILAALVYALVLGEVFVRLVAPQPLLPRNVTGSRWGVRQNLPGAEYRQVTQDVDVSVRINRQGMRADRDYPLQPPPGTCRIAVTGDSFMVGYEAEARNSIAGRLDAEMAKHGFRTETLNFAVSGFGNAEELVQFERRILPFRPTILVQGFHTTDFDDNRRSGLFALRSDGVLEPRAQTYLPGVAISDRLLAFPPYRWLDAHSQLFAAFRQKATDAAKAAIVAIRTGDFARTKTNADKTEGGDKEPAEARRAIDALGSALLQETYAKARDQGVAWLLFEVPTREKGGRFSSPLSGILLGPEMAERVVSPIEVFRARPGVAMYQPNGHGHFTPEGNRVSAELIADAIVRNDRPVLAACRAGPSADAGASATDPRRAAQ